MREPTLDNTEGLLHPDEHTRTQIFLDHRWEVSHMITDQRCQNERIGYREKLVLGVCTVNI